MNISIVLKAFDLTLEDKVIAVTNYKTLLQNNDVYNQPTQQL